MTEKVLHEVRWIETDDGFRLEIKGDKEKLRKYGPFAGGMCMGGAGGFFRRWRGGRHGRRFGYDMGPWWAQAEEAEEGQAEEN